MLVMSPAHHRADVFRQSGRDGGRLIEHRRYSMRRVSLALSLLVVMLLGLVTLAHGVTAQDATETPELDLVTQEGHPLVGSWIVSEEGSTPSIATFTSDGTVVDVETETTAAGSWEATGDNTADATFAGFFTGEGFSVYVVIRASITVSDDGETFDAPYSFTVVGNDGTVLESGNGTVTAVRMPVEPVEAGGSPLEGMPTWSIETTTGETGEGTAEATAVPTVAPTVEPTEESTAEASPVS
jgi:hypothetical protein